MRYHKIDPSLFILNRQRFTAHLPANAMAIFFAADVMPRNGDQTYPYRQNSHFFALTGIDEPDSILILYPDCRRPEYRELLFVPFTDEHTSVWDGSKINLAEAQEISGITQTKWSHQYEDVLQPLMCMAGEIFLNSNEHDRFYTPVVSKDTRMAHELRRRFPLHTLRRAQPILRELAMYKSPIELELIRQACAITGEAFQRVLTTMRPGQLEYQVEAEISYTFISHGAAQAYLPIIAGGLNACTLHYIKNDQILQSGDLVLLDFGAEYAHYAADLTRTIPVNGRFTDRQKKVYTAVLNAFKLARSMMVPGQTLAAIHKETEQYLGFELYELGLVPTKKPAPAEINAFFMHGIGHHLGLDVHDLADRYQPLTEGMVLTCEPGLYLRAEKMGIRLENDIYISAEGPVDLMAGIPMEIEEIEDRMH